MPRHLRSTLTPAAQADPNFTPDTPPEPTPNPDPTPRPRSTSTHFDLEFSEPHQLDPFPPLVRQRSGSSSASQPISYAAAAASASNSTTSAPTNNATATLGSSSRSGSASMSPSASTNPAVITTTAPPLPMRSLLSLTRLYPPTASSHPLSTSTADADASSSSGRTLAAWTADDVDRYQALDDISMVSEPSAAVAGTSAHQSLPGDLDLPRPSSRRTRLRSSPLQAQREAIDEPSSSRSTPTPAPGSSSMIQSGVFTLDELLGLAQSPAERRRRAREEFRARQGALRSDLEAERQSTASSSVGPIRSSGSIRREAAWSSWENGLRAARRAGYGIGENTEEGRASRGTNTADANASSRSDLTWLSLGAYETSSSNSGNTNPPGSNWGIMTNANPSSGSTGPSGATTISSGPGAPIPLARRRLRDGNTLTEPNRAGGYWLSRMTDYPPPIETDTAAPPATMSANSDAFWSFFNDLDDDDEEDEDDDDEHDHDLMGSLVNRIRRERGRPSERSRDRDRERDRDRAERSLYILPNDRIDVDAYGLTPDQSPGADLTRGGENRRRSIRRQGDTHSLFQLVASNLRNQYNSGSGAERHGNEVVGEDPAGHLIVEQPPQDRPAPTRREWTPTNVDHVPETQPLLVRSSHSLRRRREADSTDDDEAQQSPEAPQSDAAPRPKRRRLHISPSTSRPHPPTPSYLTHCDVPFSFFPTTFDAPSPRSHLSLTRQTSTDRPIITFTEVPRPTGTDEDACALRTTRSVPVACGVYYYECEVLSAGEKGFMSIGFMLSSVKLNRLVGWDKGSYGWHGDDGRKFEGQGTGDPFAEVWGAGDIVGAGVDYTTRRCFFTKNGKLMGHAFSNLPVALHPAVGLRTAHESLAINFTGPFKFDIQKYVQNVTTESERLVLGCDVPAVPVVTESATSSTSPFVLPSEILTRGGASLEAGLSGTSQPSTPRVALPATSPLNKPLEKTTAAFVLDYLSHHGHHSTLSLLKSGMANRGWSSTPSTSVNPILSISSVGLHALRQRLQSGSIPWSSILELDPKRTSISGPNVALEHRLLMHDLVHSISEVESARRRQEIDDAMDVEADKMEEEVLSAGRELSRRSREEKWDKQDQAYLRQVFGLLGTPRSQWPEAEMAEAREKDADELIANLRHALGLKPRSHLEHAAAQTGLVLKTLAAEADGAAAFLTVPGCLERAGKRAEKEK